MAITDSISAGLACSSTAMVGIATLTMKASTPNMNCAATTIASTHQRREVSTGSKTIRCMPGRPVRILLQAQATDCGHPGDYLGGQGFLGIWPDCCMAIEAPANDQRRFARFGTAFDVRLRHAGDRLRPFRPQGCGAIRQTRQVCAGGGERP